MKTPLTRIPALLLGTALLSVTAPSQTIPVEWIRQETGAQFTYTDAFTLAAAPGGGIHVAGFKSPSGLFLGHFDSSGNSPWNMAHPNIVEAPNGISSGASGIYTVHPAGYRVVIVRCFDSSGVLRWTRQVSSDSGVLGYPFVAADATGATVVGYIDGSFPSTLPIGGTDIFVRRYDSAGNTLWTRQFGTTQSDGVYSVVRDGSSFVLVGTTAGAFPGHTKTTTFEGFVARLDENGNLAALRQFADGSPARQVEAYGVSAAGGSLFVGGSVQEAAAGIRQGFVKRLNADFSDVWTRKFGAQGAWVSTFAAAADSAGVAVGGYVLGDLITGAPKTQEDGFVRLYDLDGNLRGTTQIDSATHGADVPRSLVWSGGALYLGGRSRGGFNGAPFDPTFRGFVVKLTPNRPPSADAGADQIVECASPSGTAVTLSGAASSDPDGDTLSYEWRDAANAVRGTTAMVNLTLPTGVHVFTLTVSDGKGGTASDSVRVTVRDTIAPSISLTLSPNVLWPANNKMVLITAAITVADACSTPSVTLESIVSNETTGAGDIADAAFGTDDRSFSLRATRLGQGTGRTYTVTYRASDTAANSATAAAAVVVPHNQ